jgi:hypothetical protein
MENGYRVFDLAPYDDAIRIAQFIAKPDLGETMFCHIPDKYAGSLVFISAAEIGKPNIDDRDITVDGHNPWIDIKSVAMNQNPGYHMYQFTFFNTVIQQKVYLYMFYFMQLSDPDKPYIYMKRDET